MSEMARPIGIVAAFLLVAVMVVIGIIIANNAAGLSSGLGVDLLDKIGLTKPSGDITVCKSGSCDYTELSLAFEALNSGEDLRRTVRIIDEGPYNKPFVGDIDLSINAVKLECDKTAINYAFAIRDRSSISGCLFGAGLTILGRDNHIYNNEFKYLGVDSPNLEIHNSENLIERNIFRLSGGIIIFTGANKNEITFNEFENGGKIQINSNENNISYNTMRGIGAGVALMGQANNNRFYKNAIIRGYNAVIIGGGNDNEFIDNTIAESMTDGIVINSGRNIYAQNSVVASDSYGVVKNNPESDTFTGNKFCFNGRKLGGSPIADMTCKNPIGVDGGGNSIKRLDLSCGFTNVDTACSGRVLEVCPSCAYTKIADAMLAAYQGDVIRVTSGTYNEMVSFAGKSFVNLSCSPNVRIVGAGSGTGITLTGDNNVVDGCTVENFRYGIFHEGTENSVFRTTLKSNYNGLAYKGTKGNIINITAKDNTDGIVVNNEFVNISGIFLNNFNGIRFVPWYGYKNVIITDSNFSENTNAGIYSRLEKPIIRSSTFLKNKRGIHLEEAREVNISSNRFISNTEHGIFLDSQTSDSKKIQIADNNISSNLEGIVIGNLKSIDGVDLLRNTICDNTLDLQCINSNNRITFADNAVGDTDNCNIVSTKQCPITRELTVCVSGCDYTSIKNAVNAATPGTRIEVYRNFPGDVSGTKNYIEGMILIDKNTIKLDCNNVAVIQPEGNFGLPAIVVWKSNVEVNSCTIDKRVETKPGFITNYYYFTYGISVGYRPNYLTNLPLLTGIKILNNRIYNTTEAGLFITQTNGFEVENNTVQYSVKNGILINTASGGGNGLNDKYKNNIACYNRKAIPPLSDTYDVKCIGNPPNILTGNNRADQVSCGDPTKFNKCT